MGCHKSSSKREYNLTSGNKKNQINNLILYRKELEKEQTKSRVSRRKEIIKIRAEINEIKTKTTTDKINETKSWNARISCYLCKSINVIHYINKLKNKNHMISFPGGAVVENLPAKAGDTGSSPGLGRSHMPRSN